MSKPAGMWRKLQDESFTAPNDPDDDRIRQQIGVYYNYMKTSNDESVVFSVPYNDTAGLGTQASRVN